MVKAVGQIKGKKELVSFLRKAFEADEKEYAEKENELQKKLNKVETWYRKEGEIVMTRKELIVACLIAGIIILFVWGVSFGILYHFMKQTRSYTLVPRGVRFTELRDSPKQTKRSPQTPPRPILKKDEPVYTNLGPIETAV